MDIVFTSEKDAAFWCTQQLLVKKQGAERARIIQRRLAQLQAAPTLFEMRSLPGRCHELRGDRAGQLSLDLDGPYRLIFEPANDPVPRKPDGGLDWREVSAVRVLEVTDTHD